MWPLPDGDVKASQLPPLPLNVTYRLDNSCLEALSNNSYILKVILIWACMSLSHIRNLKPGLWVSKKMHQACGLALPSVIQCEMNKINRASMKAWNNRKWQSYLSSHKQQFWKEYGFMHSFESTSCLSKGMHTIHSEQLHILQNQINISINLLCLSLNIFSLYSFLWNSVHWHHHHHHSHLLSVLSYLEWG